MTPRYVFDANILINIQRRQPRDLFPSVWKKITELIENGTVISSQEVFDELSRGDDSLVEWAKEHKSSFQPSDITIQEQVRSILKDNRGLVEGGKKLNNADPFVIALAMQNGCKIVTEETPTNSGSAPKIPDICNKMGIPYIDFVDFMREQKLVF